MAKKRRKARQAEPEDNILLKTQVLLLLTSIIALTRGLMQLK